MNDRPTLEDEQDEAVERLLHALGSSPVPEALESRIATGLETRIAARLAERTTSRTWWHGAIAGAASAAVVMCAWLLIQHASHTRAVAGGGALTTATGAISVSANRTAQKETPRKPCAAASARIPQAARTHALSTARSKHGDQPDPISGEPLTAEERDLVLLARRTDPKELTILNPDVRAKLDADDAAKFDDFFAPPPAPTTADTEPN